MSKYNNTNKKIKWFRHAKHTKLTEQIRPRHMRTSVRLHHAFCITFVIGRSVVSDAKDTAPNKRR